MNAENAHYAGMMKKKLQYTIRDVSERTDARLREVAAEYGTSLNKTALAALNRGLGVAEAEVEHDDLDHLIGTWVHDEECDAALADMDHIDAEVWE